MSLSPLVSFKSRFVTYLLNFPRMNLKKMERYSRVNLLGPGPRRIKKEFTGPRSHKG